MEIKIENVEWNAIAVRDSVTNAISGIRYWRETKEGIVDALSVHRSGVPEGVTELSVIAEESSVFSCAVGRTLTGLENPLGLTDATVFLRSDQELVIWAHNKYESKQKIIQTKGKRSLIEYSTSYLLEVIEGMIEA